MRKVIHKLFWIWNFDKQEKWLNEMAAKGLALISVGFFRYEFEDCLPAEYKVRLEFLNNKPNIESIEETGAEHIGTFKHLAYFRKRTNEENFTLLSDNSSIINHMTRIIRFISLILALNLYISGYNLYLYFYFNNYTNLFGVGNLLVSVFGAIGLIRLLMKRKKLKKDQLFK